MTDIKCVKNNLFKEPNEEVIKLIEYWFRKEI